MIAAEQRKFPCLPYTLILYQEKWGVRRTDFVLKKNKKKTILNTILWVQAVVSEQLMFR
jgi:hypothetical protein